MRECFCFGSEAVNASGEAVRGLVKSRVENKAEAEILKRIDIILCIKTSVNTIQFYDYTQLSLT